MRLIVLFAGVFHACVQVVLDIYSNHYMSEYNLHTIPTTSNSVHKAKAARRKVLDRVYERRKLIFKNYIKKLRDNPNKSEIDAIFD